MTASDPYARIHEALTRAVTNGDAIDEDWYLTDFLILGVAESFHPDHKGMTTTFRVGPENDMPPHRILGLLEYAAARYRHIINQHEDDE